MFCEDLRWDVMKYDQVASFGCVVREDIPKEVIYDLRLATRS